MSVYSYNLLLLVPTKRRLDRLFLSQHIKDASEISVQVHDLTLSIITETTKIMRKFADSRSARLNESLLTAVYSQDGIRPRDFLGRTVAHQVLDETSETMLLLPERHTLHACIDAQSAQAQDRLGRSILHLLCGRGLSHSVEFVLGLGADPGAITIYGSLPLHYAAVNGRREICKMLLEHSGRFSIDQKDEAGMTARDYADDRGHYEIVNLLIDAGAEKRPATEEQ